MKPLSTLALCIALVAGTVSTSAIDRGYYRHGHVVKVLPKKHVVVRHSGHRYFVHGGVYYRSYNGSFRVVAAPIGYRINVLPTGHMSFRVGPISYHYHAGNYYRREKAGYVVVAKPVGAPSLNSLTATSAAVGQLYVYPTNGQSKKRTAKDKRACRSWANAQPGTANDQAFARAYGTCLSAKGYTIG